MKSSIEGQGEPDEEPPDLQMRVLVELPGGCWEVRALGRASAKETVSKLESLGGTALSFETELIDSQHPSYEKAVSAERLPTLITRRFM